MIAGAKRVALGVQKCQHALPLVVVHEVPQRRRRERGQGSEGHDQAQLQPGQQHDEQAGRSDQQGGAEIGLRRDQHGRDDDDRKHGEELTRGRRQRPVMQVPGSHHRHRELHDFGGLKAHHAQIKPALAPWPMSPVTSTASSSNVPPA